MSDPWDDAMEEKTPTKADKAADKAVFQSPVLTARPMTKPDAPEGYVSVFVRNEWKVVPIPKLTPAASTAPAASAASAAAPQLSARGLQSLASSFRESAHNHGAASGMRDIQGDTAAYQLEEAAYAAKRSAQERRMAAFNGVSKFGTRK